MIFFISTNGGFENPSNNPFAFAPLGVLPIPSTKKRSSLEKKQALIVPNLLPASTIEIVPSANVPVQFNGICSYVLDIAFPGTGGAQVLDVYGAFVPFTAPSQLYAISFDVLGCGASGNGYVSINDYTSDIFANQDCTAPGAAWQTITGTFTSSVLGVLDIVYIHVQGNTDPSQSYFDNFIITPVT